MKYYYKELLLPKNLSTKRIYYCHKFFFFEKRNQLIKFITFQYIINKNIVYLSLKQFKNFSHYIFIKNKFLQ